MQGALLPAELWGEVRPQGPLPLRPGLAPHKAESANPEVRGFGLVSCPTPTYPALLGDLSPGRGPTSKGPPTSGQIASKDTKPLWAGRCQCAGLVSSSGRLGGQALPTARTQAETACFCR